MESRNKIILAVIVALAAAAIVWASLSGSREDKNEGSGVQQTQSNQSNQSSVSATEEPVVTPTFVYIVESGDAATYQKAMAAVDTLKTEYEGKIVFDIRDVTTNPEEAENFSAFAPPSLIMLDTHNNPCMFVSSTMPGTGDPTDVNALREAIKKALGE